MNPTTVLKLMRISAYPTLVSNVLTAWWLAGSAAGNSPPAWLLVLLLLSSSCFYLGGMVLNDFFDARLDAQERPERPIPSGEVSRREAGFLGCFLVSCGLLGVEACVSGTGSLLLRPVGWLLAAFIIGYDAAMKRIPVFGPIAMGTCRLLNIMLIVVAVNAMALPFKNPGVMSGSFGMTPMTGPLSWEKELALFSWPVFYAFGTMVYIFGVTLISNFETGPDETPNPGRRWTVRISVFFVFAGLMLLFAPILGALSTGNFMLFIDFRPISDLIVNRELTFENAPWSVFPTFLFAAVPFALLWKPAACIIVQPIPTNVRRFVGTSLGLMIPIDAVCCLVYLGILPALAVLCLYPVAARLGRIVPMS